MRGVASGLAWMGLMLPITVAAARADPAQPADKPEAETRLDAVLREWAKASEAVQETHFTVAVTGLDLATDATQHSRLEVFVKKPDLIRMDHRNEDGSLDRSFVYKEGIIHQFRASDQTEILRRLPREFGFPTQPEWYPDGFFLMRD